MTIASTPSSAFVLSNPAGLYDPSANGYSHLAVLAAGARIVCVAGQGGETETGALDADFRTQVRQAFANLRVALEAGGAGTADVFKLTVLIVDHTMDRLVIFGEELGRAFGPGMKPACTLIPVPCLALEGMLFEVEALAAVAG